MTKKGFTLIELLVTITIIAILSTIGMITYSKLSEIDSFVTIVYT